jgi:hypothetical protein
MTSYTLTHNKDFLGVLSVFALFALNEPVKQRTI